MSRPSHLKQFVTQCHNILIQNSTKECRDAQYYLHENRYLTDESIVTHSIGYCPKYHNIPDEIKFYGKDKEKVDNKNGFSYFIQGRIIVPIYSEFGDVIGIATRKPSTEPGNVWWNLPFKKKHNLFLLDKSRKHIFDKDKVYLVEGYMDALVLYQEGLKNIACLMGVFLSSRKIALITRYCNNVCFCLDVDKNNAGQKAQNEAVATFGNLGFYDKISVIDDIPVGEDPDVYVKKNGLQKYLSKEKLLSISEIKSIIKENTK